MLDKSSASRSKSKKDEVAKSSEAVQVMEPRLRWSAVIASAAIYFFSNPKPQNYYDYTYRVAGQLLKGTAGLSEAPPSWLNEFVPHNGQYFSVFPLGAVLSMLPVAALEKIGVISEMPGGLIAAILAGVAVWFYLKIAECYDITNTKRILLASAMVFGTFAWTNLTMAGAWQLALGFAVVGELGAIYFTLFDRRPLLAGLFFAIAFGNRTEILLTAPVFFYFLTRSEKVDRSYSKPAKKPVTSNKNVWHSLTSFCTTPFILGVLTLAYNYIRFNSLTDFGYARIPGVLNEPWYDHGIFSTYYISGQAWEMLIKPWNLRDTFPYLLPDGFSASILFSSPFLLLMFRVGAKNGGKKLAAWLSIIVMTILLWMHGNSGGWQFGYRYSMVLLPWIFVLILESAPRRVTISEKLLIGYSFLINLYATWLFNWTELLKQ